MNFLLKPLTNYHAVTIASSKTYLDFQGDVNISGGYEDVH